MPAPDRLTSLLQEYAASHRHPTNKWIHRVAVPIIAVDMLGLAQAIPLGAISPALPSASTLVALAAVLYYLRLSPQLGAVMAAFTVASLWLLEGVAGVLGSAFVPVLLLVFALAWAAQFYGHAVEGRRPSFFKDLQFLLVGPLWVLVDCLALPAPSPIVRDTEVIA